MKLNQMITVGLLLNLSLHTNAAEFCVTSSASLQTALDVAGSNNENDVIRITVGVFETNGSQFLYEDTGDGYDLELSGGWTTVNDNDCGMQSYGDEFATILDGESQSRVLMVELKGDANLKLSDLRFINGFGGVDGGGLKVNRLEHTNNGDVTVERNFFIDNEADFASALLITKNVPTTQIGSGTIHVRNNLFIANKANISHTINIVHTYGYGIYFTNNTVMHNEAVASFSQGAGVRISINSTTNALLVNNILMNNERQDLLLLGATSYFYRHNNVGVKEGVSPFYESFGNMNLPPRFDPGTLNFTPSAISPLVNNGLLPCIVACPVDPPFEQNWQLGDKDLAGNDRIQFLEPDMGAYESNHEADVIFWDRFES